jgi:molybdate transport system substrate-binding protein
MPRQKGQLRLGAFFNPTGHALQRIQAILEDIVRMGSLAAAAKIGFVMLLAQGVAAEAAEVKVMAAAAFAGVMAELGSQFERMTGHKLVMQYGVSRAFKRRIEAGEAFDLVILSNETMDQLAKQGKFAAGPRPEIARAGVGVAVRTGAFKPDISSVDAFKRSLLNTKSISSDPRTENGEHLAKVFERLGIAEEMRSRIKPPQAPKSIAQAVADGEAELAIGVTSNLLLARGVELVGKIPPELQNYLVFTAGVSATAKQPDAAKALIKHLTSPEAVPVITAKGWEPATR